MRVISAGKKEQKRGLAERLLMVLTVLGGFVSVAGLVAGLQIGSSPQSPKKSLSPVAQVHSAGPAAGPVTGASPGPYSGPSVEPSPPVAVPRPSLPQFPVNSPNDIREPDVKVAVSKMEDRLAKGTPKPSKRRAKPSAGANLAPRKSETFKDDFRLRGSGRHAILAYDETVALQLRTKPGLMAELVQNGLLFSLPAHAAVAIIEQHDDLVRVQERSGEFEGKVGWVRADQIEGMPACKPGVTSYCEGGSKQLSRIERSH
jgi:hypothetical protein